MRKGGPRRLRAEYDTLHYVQAKKHHEECSEEGSLYGQLMLPTDAWQAD